LQEQTKKRTSTADLVERIENLERCMEKIATLSGNGNHLLEFGLNRWEPKPKDMTKYK